jgi:hypothetical protein
MLSLLKFEQQLPILEVLTHFPNPKLILSIDRYSANPLTTCCYVSSLVSQCCRHDPEHLIPYWVHTSCGVQILISEIESEWFLLNIDDIDTCCACRFFEASMIVNEEGWQAINRWHSFAFGDGMLVGYWNKWDFDGKTFSAYEHVEKIRSPSYCHAHDMHDAWIPILLVLLGLAWIFKLAICTHFLKIVVADVNIIEENIFSVILLQIPYL